MPVDFKRLNGPEDAVPYRLFTKLNTKTHKEQYEDLFDRNGSRRDGRKLSEHRKIFLKTGVVAHAKGSSYIEQGETKVIVSVFDPREIPNKTDYSLKGEIYCEFKFAPFSCPKRRLHQQDSQEKEYSNVIKKALESSVSLHEFPNFQVDVYVLVLHNDGSAVSAAITAAGAALASAGIPMFDVVTSTTIAIQNNKILIDPDLREESLSEVSFGFEHGVITMTYMLTHEQVTQFYHVGNLSTEICIESVEVLSGKCKEIAPVVQKCLVKHVLNECS